MLTTKQWHARFLQQANWTANLRAYLFQQAQLSDDDPILEVGCGTGALLNEHRQAFGADIDLERLQFARQDNTTAILTCADGHQLPYADNSFAAVFCHYLLLWVQQPAQIISEMQRVAQPGGAIIAIAEPDYGGRIDHPDTLVEIGQAQIAALKAQDANPLLGRQLAGLFAANNLNKIETGVLNGRWQGPPSAQDLTQEWQVLRADLAGQITQEQLDAFQKADQAAWERGERVLFIPTFYAIGYVA